MIIIMGPSVFSLPLFFFLSAFAAVATAPLLVVFRPLAGLLLQVNLLEIALLLLFLYV